jgi:hypothetical protein
MSTDTGNITARFRAFIPRHPANAFGLPAQGKTLSVLVMKAHRRSRGITPLILNLGAMGGGVDGKLHAPAVYPWE